LGYKVIQDGLRRWVVLLARTADGVSQHAGCCDRGDGIHL
jgi:hypothetical protein